MKKINKGQIIFVIAMYLPYILFLIVGELINQNLYADTPTTILFILGLVLLGIGFLVGVIQVIIAIYNMFKDRESPTKTTWIVKLILIPWYVLNFFVWLLVVAAFANPWLMLAIPIVIFLGIAYTYSFVVFSSVHNISYVIYLIRNQKLKLSKKLVIFLVFHFLFCFDVLGSFLLHIYLRRTILVEE